MYIVRIKDGHVIQKFTYPILPEGCIEITEEQFNCINMPCNYENGIFKNIEVATDEVEAIREQLQQLDKTINRATEDLYTLTNTTPHMKVAEVIAMKETLREELRSLEEV